ncbi:ABC transporter permease [Halalkalibacter oceani]|uniref:ABC transporter permease n=1 Tax=Halalkalibacter oceani TaxID=1653776 RepID=UPI0033987695
MKLDHQTIAKVKPVAKFPALEWIKRNHMKFYPVLVGLLFLIMWQVKLFHKLFGLELYQLPIPLDIIREIRVESDILLLYAGFTGIEILGGFLLGSFLGFVLAGFASFFPHSGRGGVALVATLNAIPIVALAPIMNNWFGDGVLSRIGIVTVLTMATMCVNAFKGMTSIDKSYFELAKTYAASKWEIFIKIRLPHSLPNIVASLKINMTTSIIGAIVGEFFIASRGLGYLLSDQIKLGNMPLAWACITLAAMMGIILYYLVDRLELVLMPWKRKSQRSY